MSRLIEFARSTTPCIVQSGSAAARVSRWFTSPPVDQEFCFRAAQLQLSTDSCEQQDPMTRKPATTPGSTPESSSWFEVAIHASADDVSPRYKNDRPLVWKSHFNNFDSESHSRHFGLIHDRRGRLLDELQIGDVLVVTVCAKDTKTNNAQAGWLTVKLLDADLFCPQWWALTESKTPSIPPNLENGVFTISSTTAVTIEAKSSSTSSRIWFSTPALDEDLISRIEKIQLHTTAKDQGYADFPELGSWSWFDIAILDSPLSTQPRMEGGRELVWFSHHNKTGVDRFMSVSGDIFQRPGSELFNLLKPGNAIALRVCAKFPGWENHAERGNLVIKVSNKVHTPIDRGTSDQSEIDYEALQKQGIKIRDTTQKYYAHLAENMAEIAYLPVAELLAANIRADDKVGDPNGRALRLLSLDGGGIRGISTLHILESIMLEVGRLQQKDGALLKPCQYFDMIAGASTGGLVAIMLGRLKMTVESCIDAYKSLALKVFTNKVEHPLYGTHYEPGNLEGAVRAVVAESFGNPDLEMEDEKSPCKVFVLACHAKGVNNNEIVLFRTYTNKKKPDLRLKTPIWKAARATSAAPTYFPEMQIGDEIFVDGGVAHNNPAVELIVEAKSHFGPARPIQCLISIGTGKTPNVSFLAGLLNAFDNLEVLKKELGNTEYAHQNARDLCESVLSPVVPYFRFNVGFRTESGDWQNIAPEMDEAAKMDEFANHTKVYLKLDEQVKEIQRAAALVV